jgi:integrase
MARKRLTDAVVKAAACAKGTDRCEPWDAVSTGLVLRVTEAGAKSWYAIYRSPVTSKQTKLRLGDVKTTDAMAGLTLAEARSTNIQVQSDVDAGRDPRIERERAQAEERRRLEAQRQESAMATFRALVNEYLAEKQSLRAGTIKSYQSALDNDILPALGHKLVREITALDFEVVIERVAKKGKRARARTVKTALGSVWGWARRTAKWRALGVTRDLLSEVNPDLTTKGAARKRKLTDAELRELWKSVEASNLGKATKIAFKLTVLLGERSTELIHAPWSEIVDLDGVAPRWVLPAERNKGKTEKVLPLPPMAAELLRELRNYTGKSPWLIPGRGDLSKPAHAGLLVGSIRHLRQQKLLTIAKFSPHDLRRTMANRMEEELEISSEAIKGVLGHARSDVTSVHYTQGQKLGAKLAALSAWERRVKEIVGFVPVIGEGNVVELKRA